MAHKVANLKIKWSTYKLRPKQDKLSVFVSIVSTKIPFKGTSKEYVGDDHGILHDTIKTALLQCCRQLKHKVVRANSLKLQRERHQTILKYVPGIARSLLSIVRNDASEQPLQRVSTIQLFGDRAGTGRDEEVTEKDNSNEF